MSDLRKDAHGDFYDVGIRGVVRNLVVEVVEVERLTCLLLGARLRRNALVLKLKYAGLGTREIGAIAHLSSPAVSTMREVARPSSPSPVVAEPLEQR